MRILNENDVEIAEYDPSIGYLVEETIFVKHHRGSTYKAEEGHYEVVREYPNGGKDVEWVVDVKGREAKAPWDEYETIQRLVPYTQEELNTIRLNELKQLLDTVERVTTDEYYADLLSQRDSLREEINELEGM